MSWFRLSCLTLLLVMLCLEITDADETKQKVRPAGHRANDGKKALQATQKDKQKKPASGASGQKQSAKGNGRITLAPRTTTGPTTTLKPISLSPRTTTTTGPTTLRPISLSPRTVPLPPNPTPCACEPCNPVQSCCVLPLDPCYG